jgi:hypothetical protein
LFEGSGVGGGGVGGGGGGVGVVSGPSNISCKSLTN